MRADAEGGVPSPPWLVRVNVLVVTNMWPTPGDPSFGCFVEEQVDDLRRLGLDVDVISFDGRRARRNYARAAWTVRAAVRQRPVSVVHAHYGLTGAVAAMQRSVPVITTFHGSDTGYVPWQARVSRIVAARTTPLFVSRAGAYALGRPNAAVLPAPVDVDRFVPLDRSEARARLGWKHGVPYALFPGSRTNRRKRPDLFAAAVAEARRAVPRLQMAVLENLSRDEVVLALNAADVTVMVSDWEGSPVTVRESLACMTPVVSVDVGDVREVLAGLPACAIAKRDACDLGGAIVHTLAQPREPALRVRAELTSRPRIAGRLVALYDEVACAG
jgi:teichuronic acid biosynthesis glycosyltransferase TuaC